MYQEPLPPQQQLPVPRNPSNAPTTPAPSPYARPPAPPYGQPGPAPTPYPYPSAPRYAPPSYVYEPLPPPPLRHRAPVQALWLGIRGGALFPSGDAYEEFAGTDNYGYDVYATERWSNLAGSGPSFEANVGGRFARHYVLYGLWEHAWLSPSTYPSPEVAGRGDKASTDFAGVGFRWSSNPDAVGIVADIALGYRWFRETWPDTTKLDLRGFGETRIGLGADIRVSNALSFSPMLSLSFGSFSERNLKSPSQGTGSFGESASHSTVSLTLGAHYDLAP